MLQEIAQCLREQCPSLKGRVECADSYESALENNKFNVPCAYVVELSDRGEPNTLMGVFRQRITTQVGILMVTSNKRDATGGTAHSELGIMRKEVFYALAGWCPADAEPMNFLAGVPMEPYSSYRFWASVFTTQFYYRK